MSAESSLSASPDHAAQEANEVVLTGKDARISNRLPVCQSGAIVLAEGERRVTVDVLDISFGGFGIVSPEKFDPGTAFQLEVLESGAVDIYDCKVTFCRPDGKAFFLGLSINELVELDP